MPPHSVYIEPLLWFRPRVFFRKPAATHEILNDLGRNLMMFFRVLRERWLDLAKACALTPYARAEQQAADLDVDDVERARRFCGRRRCGAGPRVIPLAVFS
jgi:DNA adenine methylase